jgi:hypothetical protein
MNVIVRRTRERTDVEVEEQEAEDDGEQESRRAKQQRVIYKGTDRQAGRHWIGGARTQFAGRRVTTSCHPSLFWALKIRLEINYLG